MFLILLVLQDVTKLDEVIQAWEQAGVNGITILRSLGMANVRKVGLREDMPIIPSLDDFLHHEDFNRTIFTVTDSETMVDNVISVTEAITGDLDQPNTGVLVVLPVLRARGLHRKKSK